MRALIVATALATMMGTPALAQRAANDGGPISSPAWTTTAPAGGYMQRAQARRVWRAGEGAYAAVPDRSVTTHSVYSNYDYIGWDPDPNIRFQLLRDPKGAGSQ